MKNYVYKCPFAKISSQKLTQNVCQRAAVVHIKEARICSRKNKRAFWCARRHLWHVQLSSANFAGSSTWCFGNIMLLGRLVCRYIFLNTWESVKITFNYHSRVCVLGLLVQWCKSKSPKWIGQCWACIPRRTHYYACFLAARFGSID